MAGAKEIRTQIKSIKNTKKITKAMEMVAASKMRRAQTRMAASRPYADKIWNVIGHLANAHPEYKHSYMIPRETKRIGIIVVTTDRGLCGSLNVNLFRTALKTIQEYQDQNIEIDFCVFGQKGLVFFKRFGGNIVAESTHLGDKPHLSDVIGPLKVMLDAYDKGEIDKLFLIKNNFINSISQKPECVQLLPIVPKEDEALQHHWDYLYEPDSQVLLDQLLDRYLESLVYQAVIENIACEMSARMIAMKNATENAGELIRELTLVYNKARQAAITTEIAEIVGGAAALE